MPSKNANEDYKILKYILGDESLKVPFIIYADLECLLQKIKSCQNSSEKSYTEKKAVHRPSGYSLITCCSFDKSKNERKYYRGNDCMKIFCGDLKEQANEIINYEKKEMIPLTDKKNGLMKIRKVVIYVKKNFVLIKTMKNLKQSKKSEIIVIIQENIEDQLIVIVI